MLARTLIVASLLVICSVPDVVAQDAAAVVAAASKAMGVDNLNAIAYIGRARAGSFGQSKSIGDPMGAVNLTSVADYTRVINFAKPDTMTALVSRASGTAFPPRVPGGPMPTPGALNQTITAAQAAATWAQALNIWMTPWGFLKGAAVNTATVRRQGGQQIVSFSPAGFTSPSGGSYMVTGYLSNQNLVTKVETRVDHAVVGDLLVEFEYSGYQTMNGVQVPARVVQRQAGLQTFEMSVESATPNPSTLAELLAPPTPPGGPAPPPAQQLPAAPPVQRIGDGVFKIGGNYTSLAIDMGDHVLVVETGQSDARGTAVMAAAREAIPSKPIRFVVNSHPHFDHAGGLAAAVAEGATILTHRNNEQVLERLLSGSRSLIGDSLSKASNRAAVVEGIGSRDVRKGTSGKIVELHHIPNEHSDGMLAVFLPAEKVLWTADITVVNPNPVQLATVRAAVATLKGLKLDYDTWIPAHPPNPDRPLTRADVLAAAGPD